MPLAAVNVRVWVIRIRQADRDGVCAAGNVGNIAVAMSSVVAGVLTPLTTTLAFSSGPFPSVVTLTLIWAGVEKVRTALHRLHAEVAERALTRQ